MAWILYRFFALIDSVIYGVASALFRIIFDLANVQFFTNDQIKAVTSRVYIVVGVLMLFKLVISAVQYLINPDAFEDKEKGLAGILKKTAISIGLIVIVPTVFQFLMAIQGPIIKTLPSVILGASPSETINDQSIGFDLSFQVLSTFIRPREGKGGSVSDSAGKVSGEIHDMGSFMRYVTEGCGHWIWNWDENCRYDYKIFISTISGAFLCYILLSMTLDVAIRTIKMGIIQLLAPIPISGYIVSKDMLNKFVKTASSVYLDLFIRMGVIYFVIFAIQAILETGILGFGIVAGVDTGNWFRSIVVNVIIIYGLLMFASKAPKFITDLLGLPDVGSGDIADMFKRAGGLFGATTSGLKTAVSNYVSQKERYQGKGFSDKEAKRKALRSAAAGLASSTGRGFWMASQGKGFKDVHRGASAAAIAAREKRNDKYDNIINTEGGKYLKDENGNYVYEMEDYEVTLPDGTKAMRKRMKRDKNGVPIKVLNPDYYSRFDYFKAVQREKFGIPSSEGYVKARYDAMDAIAKIAADSRSHGTTKMNETPNKFKVDLTTGALAGNVDAQVINSTLGFDSLSMEQIRNMYAMARNGGQITKADGTTKVTLSDAQLTSLGSLLQVVEKRTSYLKEAELMATGDPTASPNVDKLVLGITNNKDMFNDAEIREPIMVKLEKYLDDKRVSNDPTSSDYHKIKIGQKVFDLSSYEGILSITKELQQALPDDKDEADKIIKIRADILTGIKDGFEEVSKQQYKPAQLSDNRAQKAQKAVNNNEKKG